MPVAVIEQEDLFNFHWINCSSKTYKNVFQQDTRQSVVHEEQAPPTNSRLDITEFGRTRKTHTSGRKSPNIADLILQRETLIAAPNYVWKNGRKSVLVSGSPYLPNHQGRDGIWTTSMRMALYGIFKPTHSWKESLGLGSTFVTRFSPSGKMLMAGYENRVVDIIHVDQNSSTRIENAHSDCVNNACWIDDLHFSTGSDDQSVSIWDVRDCTKALSSTKVYNLQPNELFRLGEVEFAVKDLHYFPSNLPSHPAYLIITTFAASIFRAELGPDFRFKDLRALTVRSGCSRSALFPVGHSHAGKLILSYRDSCCLDLVDVLATPLKLRGISVCTRHGDSFVRSVKDILEPYRSLTIDPVGEGFLAGQTTKTKLSGRRSNVTYVALETKNQKFKCARRFFFPQKGSESVYQSSAFSPNGYFIASPQDRRVDILTNGPTAQVFNEYKGGPKQFTVASVLPFPKCGDIICADVSPRDNATIASGCELGHVHISQPAF